MRIINVPSILLQNYQKGHFCERRQKSFYYSGYVNLKLVFECFQNHLMNI